MARLKADMRNPMVTQSLSNASNVGNGWEGWELIAKTTLTSATAVITFSAIGSFEATPNENIYTHMRIFGYFKNDSTESDILFEWDSEATTSDYLSWAIDTVTHNSGTGTSFWSGTYTTSLAGHRVGHLYSSDSCLIDVIHSGEHGSTADFYGNMFTGYASVNNDNTLYAQWGAGKFHNGGVATKNDDLKIKATGGSFAVGTTVAILGNRYGYGD